MSQWRSILDITAEVRRRADRPSKLRPTDADIQAMARESWRSLYALLIKADPARFLKQGTISVIAGVRFYDLDSIVVDGVCPADVWKIIGVAVQDTSNPEGWSILDRLQWDERYDYPLATDAMQARYEIRASRLWLQPTPTWSRTVRVEYIPLASWTSRAFASAPTTPSTQATGAGNTAWRVNCAATTVALGQTTTAISAAADYVVHSGSLLLTAGQSVRARLVAKNLSGAVSVAAIKGTAATTGTELEPTDSEVQTTVGVDVPWVDLARIRISRTGDTTVTQQQDAVDHIDASNGVDEWLICDVSAKIKALDEEDPNYFVAQRATVEHRLLSEQVLDVGKPKQVTIGRRRLWPGMV